MVRAWFQWCSVLKFEENWALPPVCIALIAIKFVVEWLVLGFCGWEWLGFWVTECLASLPRVSCPTQYEPALSRYLV